MDDLLLLARVAVSLAAVLGLVWFVGRRVAAGGKAGRRTGRRSLPHVRVLGRQSLGRHSGVALVAVGERTLLLGVAEQGVSVLADVTDPDDVAPDATGGAAEESDAGVLALVPAGPSPQVPADVEDLPVRSVARTGGELREELDLDAMLASLDRLPVAAGDRGRGGYPAPSVGSVAARGAVHGAGRGAHHSSTRANDVRASVPGPSSTAGSSGPLDGSILAPGTWRRTWDVLQQRTVRR